jgi:hypothetical protein
MESATSGWMKGAFQLEGLSGLAAIGIPFALHYTHLTD